MIGLLHASCFRQRQDDRLEPTKDADEAIYAFFEVVVDSICTLHNRCVCAAVPGFIVCFGGMVLPDSPVSLMERAKVEQARQVLERVRGLSDVDEEFEVIAEAARQSVQVRTPWKNLFKSGGCCMPAEGPVVCAKHAAARMHCHRHNGGLIAAACLLLSLSGISSLQLGYLLLLHCC